MATSYGTGRVATVRKMKKYILPNDVNWYRANMHCHTTCSDGSLTPEEVKEAYKAKGYSIVAYTDHEIMLDHSDLNDENFLAITSSEYSVNEADPSFPQLGEHDGPWQRKKVVHMNVFSPRPHDTFQPATSKEQFGHIRERYNDVFSGDGYIRTYSTEGVNEIIRRCNEAGFLVQFNHPNWSLNEKDDYTTYKGLWSLEILNYATECISGAEYCPYIYDEMVRSGMHNLFCSMGDDNHNRGKSLGHSFGGSTIIGAKELEYGQVFDALKNGDFYCTSGRDNPPMIKALYVEDNVVKIDFTPATNVFLTGYCRSFRFYDEGGAEFTHAEFPLWESDVMFRITVRDKFGNNAHTHYYKVSDYLEK